ncbi:phage portal protein [Jiella marina]|uniref:phage portal protein n=1 Tax=Jiella sp. LLJ827 TaxID=2917712 RepID=UPI0021009D71|nr:phage portal protein [Jiella sp. LLJ827]MCQ0986411.1 phage portal protein [Jiella sp. LLJ827]
MSTLRSLVPVRGSPVERPAPSAGYLRGEPGMGVSLAMPRPVLRDRADNIRAAWPQVNARADDALINNGWIAGCVEQVVALMIGSELRLSYKPDCSAFGWDAKQTRAFASRVEGRFRIYGSQPREVDAHGRYTLGQLQAAVVRQWFGTGEVPAEIDWLPRAGCETGTKVRLIPSHWLSQKTDPLTNLYQGVRSGLRDPEPVSYLFETRDPMGFCREVEKRARDGFGRPKIVHVFDGVGNQVRGITPLAPALKIVRQFDQLADATLTAAMIHAIFAATIESDYPTEQVLQALQGEGERDELAGAFNAFLNQTADWHKNVNIDLGRHGKIAHLLMGEKLKLHGSEHPNATYEAFANFLLREIASCLGVMFEDLTGDYRGATYSSIRMGIAKKWPLMEYRRRVIPGRFTQALFEAWLEEEIDAGRIEIPGGIDAFVANRTSLCKADWKGPPKPQADDAKAAKAHQTWFEMGVMSREQICNDLGADHEEVIRQRVDEEMLENELRAEAGLPPIEPRSRMIGHNGGPAIADEDDDQRDEAA